MHEDLTFFNPPPVLILHLIDDIVLIFIVGAGGVGGRCGVVCGVVCGCVVVWRGQG